MIEGLNIFGVFKISYSFLHKLKKGRLSLRLYGYKEFNSSASNQNYNLNDIKDNLMDALNKSIIEENYEVAAKLRDRIKKLNAKKI